MQGWYCLVSTFRCSCSPGADAVSWSPPSRGPRHRPIPYWTPRAFLPPPRRSLIPPSCHALMALRDADPRLLLSLSQETAMKAIVLSVSARWEGMGNFWKRPQACSYVGHSRGVCRPLCKTEADHSVSLRYDPFSLSSP